MKQWDIHSCDMGWGVHPMVVVSHPDRAGRKDFVELLDCSSQRAARPAAGHEVLLDVADGLDWPTLCKCDCIYAVLRDDVGPRRGRVPPERRRKIIQTIVESHGWLSP